MYGVGATDGAGVIPGANVGFRPGARVDKGLGFGASVGRFLQTGTRQHGSLGSVSNVHPAGTLVYWAHLEKFVEILL